MVVYFGDEVADALENYIEADRKVITPPLPAMKKPYFCQRKESVWGFRQIENMVKKYARQVTPNKKSHLISFVVPMARRYIRKQVIVYHCGRCPGAIKMLIRPKNIMQLLMKTDVVWRLRQ